MENRVGRWMSRNPTSSLERKMLEFRTESVREYFEIIFEGTLTEDELKLARHLQLEYDFRFFYQE